MTSKIPIPVDGSEGSNEALELACELGERREATLHDLRIAQLPPGKRVIVLGAAAITLEADPEELEATGRQVVSSAEDIPRGHGFDKVAVSVLGGDSAARIID